MRPPGKVKLQKFQFSKVVRPRQLIWARPIRIPQVYLNCFQTTHGVSTCFSQFKIQELKLLHPRTSVAKT